MSPNGAREDKGKAKDDVQRSARHGPRRLTLDQYERLIKVIALLAPRYYYQHEELARDLGISTRTLQRDVRALWERGVLVEQSRGGYRLPVKRDY